MIARHHFPIHTFVLSCFEVYDPGKGNFSSDGETQTTTLPDAPQAEPLGGHSCGHRPLNLPPAAAVEVQSEAGKGSADVKPVVPVTRTEGKGARREAVDVLVCTFLTGRMANTETIPYCGGIGISISVKCPIKFVSCGPLRFDFRP